MRVTTIGLDLAKHLFQAHGVDAQGRAVLRKRLRRAEVLRFFAGLPPCLVAMEAGATAHQWARELMALGHEVRLVPPAYVKPYVRRGKSDAVDAEAIREAATRPSMRFVPVKSAGRQAVLGLHRARELLIRQRTMLVNALRAHLAEFGIVAPRGIRRVPDLIAAVEDEGDTHPGDRARGARHRRRAAPRPPAPHRGPRPAHRRVVREQRGGPPARDHPGDRPDHGVGARGLRRRPSRVPLGPALRRLAGPRAQAELDRRQDAAGPDLQEGRPLPAQAARRRHDGGDPLRPEDPRARARVGQRAAGAPAGAARHGRAGEQDGTHRLGGPHARRGLPGAGRGDSLTEPSARHGAPVAGVRWRDGAPVEPGSGQPV